MNEIEFRLERTPGDESDDEIQHDEIPTGKCIAPIFDKRLKHFRVTKALSDIHLQNCWDTCPKGRGRWTASQSTNSANL